MASVKAYNTVLINMSKNTTTSTTTTKLLIAMKINFIEISQ